MFNIGYQVATRGPSILFEYLLISFASLLNMGINGRKSFYASLIFLLLALFVVLFSLAVTFEERNATIGTFFLTLHVGVNTFVRFVDSRLLWVAVLSILFGHICLSLFIRRWCEVVGL